MRLVTTAAIVFALVVVTAGTPLNTNRPLALVGATVLTSPSDPAIRNGIVLIKGHTIAAVGRRGEVQLPDGIDVIDCSGLTIAAGFWNSHVHFMERKWEDVGHIPTAELAEAMEEMLTRYGFTSVFDLGSRWVNTRTLRDKIETGEIPGPRIYSTGEFLVPRGGSARDLVFDIRGAMHIDTPELVNAESASNAATKVLAAGTDGVKLYLSTAAPPRLTLPDDAIQAAVTVARSRGKPVFAHPSTREGLLAAVRARVDVIVHTAPQAGAWDDALVDAMLKARVALIPTLKLWEVELRHDRQAYRHSFVALALKQLERWNRAGGSVLFGTDVGYFSDYDPSAEYALMAEAGLSTRQILASLTTAPAERFGHSNDTGRIAPGLAADLVVLRRNPVEDVHAFAAVRYTIRAGRIIYRGSIQ